MCSYLICTFYNGRILKAHHFQTYSLSDLKGAAQFCLHRDCWKFEGAFANVFVLDAACVPELVMTVYPYGFGKEVEVP